MQKVLNLKNQTPTTRSYPHHCHAEIRGSNVHRTFNHGTNHLKHTPWEVEIQALLSNASLTQPTCTHINSFYYTQPTCLLVFQNSMSRSTGQLSHYHSRDSTQGDRVRKQQWKVAMPRNKSGKTYFPKSLSPRVTLLQSVRDGLAWTWNSATLAALRWRLQLHTLMCSKGVSKGEGHTAAISLRSPSCFALFNQLCDKLGVTSPFPQLEAC